MLDAPRRALGAWIAIGAGIGAAIGVATNDIGAWLAVGVALGAVAGAIGGRRGTEDR